MYKLYLIGKINYYNSSPLSVDKLHDDIFHANVPK